MDANKLYEKFEQMRDEKGADALLTELYKAMTTNEAERNRGNLEPLLFYLEETRRRYLDNMAAYKKPRHSLRRIVSNPVMAYYPI